MRPVPPASAPALLATARGPVEYVEAGAGPAVLSVHGAMGGHDQSLLLARTIGEDGYRHLAFSRPGYLGTPLASGRTHADQGDLLAAALDALGVDRAAVMAVSGGGPAAIQLAVRHPARVSALVLVSTSGGIIDTPIPWTFHLTKLLLRWEWLAAKLAAKAAADPEGAAARSIPDPALRARTLGDPEAGPLFRELLSSTMDRAARRLPGTENDIALTRRTLHALESVAAPTLIVHGTEDSVVPFRHGEELARRIPGAELLRIDGGEHVAIFTHRDVVRARVTAFVRAHAAGGAVAA